jgi:hypothetical protein
MKNKQAAPDVPKADAPEGLGQKSKMELIEQALLKHVAGGGDVCGYSCGSDLPGACYHDTCYHDTCYTQTQPK